MYERFYLAEHTPFVTHHLEDLQKQIQAEYTDNLYNTCFSKPVWRKIQMSVTTCFYTF